MGGVSRLPQREGGRGQTFRQLSRVGSGVLLFVKTARQRDVYMTVGLRCALVAREGGAATEMLWLTLCTRMSCCDRARLSARDEDVVRILYVCATEPAVLAAFSLGPTFCTKP